MATTKSTQIVLQQVVNLQDDALSASKYPKYTVSLGYLIGNITASELSGAISEAQASAAAAKVSETNSKASETAAKNSQTAAKTSETNAKTSETNSKTSETAAKNSETAALASQNAAKTSETNAKTSETNSKNSETAALASQNAAKISETNSKNSETAALASQNAAKTSETNAKTSETNSKNSETAAKTSETNAKASETAAGLSKNAAALSETNAKNSETAAKASETNSKASEVAAKASETASKTSETNAKTSETNSKNSETAAKTSETNSKASEVAAGESADFALVQADRAEEIKNSMPSKEQFMATVKLYDTHQEAVDDLEWRDAGEKVLIWDETPAAYGWFDVVEENGVKSLELDRNELKIKSINNVRPDDAGNVQITLPGGNPSLWLGETVLFQYDPDQGIGYSGLLPQDGRMVLRVDYPDMWNAIAQGLVPSVTEDAWQAGSQNSFSTGDGSTNFRLPKWNGEAIRTPVIGEEGDEFFDQIPYVVTVNGIAPDEVTGNVQLTGLAKSGVNSDITSLTGLSGTLRLGADAASDYDAVTLKQLLANSDGASGPSLTGVMNNFIGAATWFNGTRAKLPAGHLASDGQILNRADYAELWNAISTGMVQSVTDAVWLASGANRASYSTGDGSTTFRMPDLNGKTSGSILGLFLRGDGTGYTSGSVLSNAAPNVTGAFSVRKSQTYPTISNVVGSMSYTEDSNSGTSASQGSASYVYDRVTFDASKSSASYGRDTTTEVRPNTATGIWLIRVNGKFSASSTNFNVITGDTTLPANSTVVYGGDIRSVYQVAGADYVVARLRATATIGTSRGAVISLQDSSSGSVVNTDWVMPATGGTLVLSTDTRITGALQRTGGTMTGQIASSTQGPGLNKSSAGTVSSGGTSINYLGQSTLNANQYMTIDVTGTSSNIITRIVTWNTTPKVFGFYDNGNGICDGQWIGGSDERHKSNIQLVPNALEAVLSWRGCTYDKKDGPSEVGLIAQDIEKDCPEAVTNTGKRTYTDGTVIEDFKSLNTAGVSAAYHTEAIKELHAMILSLQAKITELENK